MEEYFTDGTSEDEIDKEILKPSYSEQSSMVDRYRGNLSHDSIMRIINQRAEFLEYKRKENHKVWGESGYNPDPTLDRIVDRIMFTMIKETTDLLENTCDQFIDCLVHNEFFGE